MGGRRRARPLMLCYTSGTTGNPKGVLYEHRSTMIHAMAEIAPRYLRSVGAARSCCRSCRCSTPPPGACRSRRRCDGRQAGLFGGQRARAYVPADERGEGDPFGRRADRLAGDVPARRSDRRDAADLKHVTIGGSAAPRAMIERLLTMGVESVSLGHDRDLADRHGRRAAGALGRVERRRAGRSHLQAGPGAVRRRAAHRRRRRATCCRATARARAGCRSAGRG